MQKKTTTTNEKPINLLKCKKKIPVDQYLINFLRSPCKLYIYCIGTKLLFTDKNSFANMLPIYRPYRIYRSEREAQKQCRYISFSFFFVELQTGNQIEISKHIDANVCVLRDH
jgi:hypothetical protein